VQGDREKRRTVVCDTLPGTKIKGGWVGASEAPGKHVGVQRGETRQWLRAKMRRKEARNFGGLKEKSSEGEVKKRGISLEQTQTKTRKKR